MKHYEEVLKKARITGKGYIHYKFKEKATYIKSGDLIKDGYRCPHCKQYDIKKDVEVIDKYETPEDINFMINDVGYSWTEDCKCRLCGELYSQSNGC